MAIYAQIQGGVVINTIVATAGDTKSGGYTWVDVTAYNPIPGVGWTTSDNTNFSNTNTVSSVAYGE